MTDPRVLLNEVWAQHQRGLSMTAAWRKVLDRPAKPAAAAAEMNQDARSRAFRHMTEIPGTTVGQTRPGRQIITFPRPERKPGETVDEYNLRARLRALKTQDPAHTVRAKAVDSSNDSDIFAERQDAIERGNYERKQAAIARDQAIDKEAIRLAEQHRSAEEDQLGVSLQMASLYAENARRLMKSRGESGPGVFKRTLLEVSQRPRQ